MKNTSAFILNNFIQSGFFDDISTVYELVENDESGESRLSWYCKTEKNRCISNLDKKHTELDFLKIDAGLHLYKRVDHAVFELNEYKRWDVHLIEMKTGVESFEKWTEIKGKFRASYLTLSAIAAILNFEIGNFYFYTTYEHASFMNEKENTVTRKVRLGKKTVKPEDEWSGRDFGLNIGDRLEFNHSPIKMRRGDDGVLIKEEFSL